MESVTQETPLEQLPDPSQLQTPASPPAELDDAAVREAIAQAEAKGIDPESLSVGDIGSPPPPAKEPPKEVPADVPAKFLKPDGEVDVDKLKASTKQLDEALQAKEADVQKTIDDYLQEYRAKESKFRNLPNPQKLAASLPSPTPAEAPPALTADQLRQRIEQDMQKDFVGTVSDLVDVLVQQRLKAAVQPLEEGIQLSQREREDARLRNSLKEIASKDPRILNKNVFAAINAKLESEPTLFSLKNPYKAAWLEVKEELRLGDPVTSQAHPSKSPSPVLAGGSPPPTPSSSSQMSPANPASIIESANLLDKKQEAQADAMLRAFFAKQDRW